MLYFDVLNKLKSIEVKRQKKLQKEFSDKVFKTYFTKKIGNPYPDSLIGNFVDFYSLIKAVSMLPFSIKNKSILSMCSGDAPEGEYLYSCGAKVTVTDISSEAIKAAKRRCPQLKGVVADSENLPFNNNSFDLVLVRHGLHHLAHPYKGLDEMHRIGGKGFIFIEAQRNFITKILIKLGFAEEYEESGNFVYRFTRREVVEFMNKNKIKNYKILTFWVYHFEFLTQQVYPRLNNKIALFVFKFLFFLFNFIFGYLGNSMVVVALKE